MSAPIRAKVEAEADIKAESNIGSDIGSDQITQDLWRHAETDAGNNAAVQLEDLLARGADINARDGHGVTALVRAVYKGQLEMVRALIDHGADMNATSESRFTLLGLAAFFGHTDVVRFLVERGADIRKATRFGTPEEMAATARSFYEIGQYLERERSGATESSTPQTSSNEVGVMPSPPENKAVDEISMAEPFRAEQQQPAPAESDVTMETPRIGAPDQSISQPTDKSFEPGQKNEHASAKPVPVRTLKDPPEIWDLVQETPEHFNPRSAFVTRLTSSKTSLVLLMLAVILISGLGTFAFMKLRDRKNAAAAAQVQEQRGADESLPASQESAPVNAPASAPVDAQLNSELNTTPSSGSGVDSTPSQPTAQPANGETTDSKPPASQPPDSQPIAQPDNPASSSEAFAVTGQPSGVSVSNISKRTSSRAGRGKNADTRLARGESENLASTKVQPPQTADLKQADEKRSSDSSAKKGSNPTPQSIAPPTTNSTPKPKVIQWP
jgi:ankyrin repeat protein